MEVLLLAPAPKDIAPGQRFRFEQFLLSANEKGINFTLKPFLSARVRKLLYQKNHTFQKLAGISVGYLRRLALLFTLHKYDCVYVYKEAAPVGPPFFEWIIAKVFRKKLIFDFDDSIWVKLASDANPLVANLKCSWKVKEICKYSSLVTVGNQFLADFALQYNKNVQIIPTVVNTETRHNRIKDHSNGKLIIGWTGTFTNLKYLELAIPALIRLKKKHHFEFLIIADKDPEYKNIEYSYLPWNLNTEIDDLMQVSIGIMPLNDTEVEKGKCAFKAIQYMSLGIPAVVSPVGTNKKVVEDGINGYWAANEEEWYNNLEKLLMDPALRNKMGQQSRNKVVNAYSVKAIENAFYAAIFSVK